MMRLPLFFLFTSLLTSEIPGKYTPTSLQRAAIQEWKFFDGNNILCTINSAGPYADYLRTHSSGLSWPNGSLKTAVFTSGLWIIGRHRPTGDLRTAVQNYQTEFQPGPMLGTFNTSLNNVDSLSDPTNPKYRIYKINKKDSVGGVNPDYDDWPGDLGAPYIDINNDCRWTKGIDKPKFFGDQQIWSVYNDGDTARHNQVGVTPPIGIEVHALFYGFERIDLLVNTMFIRFTIINKSNAAYDSLLIGLWSDTDLGDASDDLPGYDSLLRLAFFYNGDNNDAGASGYGSRPPANGYVFLGSDKELTPFAHSIYTGGGVWSDPPQGSSLYAAYANRYLKGIIGNTGSPYINPLTNTPSRFVFTGDPVTGQGWLPSSQGLRQGDHRSVLSIGPTEFLPNDTIVIDAAFVIEQGEDRLRSITKLRTITALLHSMYRNSMQVPVYTAQPAFIPDSVRLHMHVDGKSFDAQQIVVQLVSAVDGSHRYTVLLNDAGENGDVNASDKLFSRTITVPRSVDPLTAHTVITDASNNSVTWSYVKRSLSMSLLSIHDPLIVSEDIHDNGLVDAGENIRFTVALRNENTFPLSGISIKVTNTWGVGFAAIDAIPAGGEIRPTYSATTKNSFLSFTLPKNYPSTTVRVELETTDDHGNVWYDTVEFPVYRKTVPKAAGLRLSGRGILDFDVLVVDSAKTTGDTYHLQGIDSANTFYGLGLLNATTGEIAIPAVKLFQLDINQQNHLLPEVDGFKIRINKLPPNHTWTTTFASPVAQWFTAWPTFPLWNPTIPTTIHPGDIPNTVIRFSAMTGYTDWNNNGLFDDTEPYTYDLTDSGRTQKAFVYNTGYPSFIGFVNVPFAVYDLLSDPPRKLSVVIRRNHPSPVKIEWWRFGGDRIFVMDSTYRPNGVMYDSTKGGINLLPILQSNGTLPYYYEVTMTATGNHLKDTGNYFINFLPGFSSRDKIAFTPSDAYPPENIPTTMLFQNFPNPFNSSTTIRFSLPRQGNTEIVIYNVLGQSVRTLLNEFRPAGTFETIWNGRDDNGRTVASGLYIYRIVSAGVTVTKKMILLK